MSEISQVKISKIEQEEIDNELEKATDLMEEGAKEESKAIIEKLLFKYPIDENIYFQAMFIYSEGEMYLEILELFDRYKKKTKKEMGLDISTVSKEEYEKRYREYLIKNPPVTEQGGNKKFKRLQWLLYLIEWIEINDNGIRFKKIGVKDRFYRWSDTLAVLRKIDIMVDHRSSSRGLIIQTSDGKKYKMQVNIYDKNSIDFLTEVRKRLKIKHGSDKQETIFLAVPALIFIILIAYIFRDFGFDSGMFIGFIIVLPLYSLISSRF